MESCGSRAGAFCSLAFGGARSAASRFHRHALRPSASHPRAMTTTLPSLNMLDDVLMAAATAAHGTLGKGTPSGGGDEGGIGECGGGTGGEAGGWEGGGENGMIRSS